jgi:hypothetical protein
MPGRLGAPVQHMFIRFIMELSNLPTKSNIRYFYRLILFENPTSI